MVKRSLRSRGFSLVELGVVLGVIAILSAVLIGGRFFVESAKMGSAVQTVNSIRQASRAYATRVCGGIGFSCPTGTLSVAALQAENLLPPSMCSPWATCGPGVTGVGVTAVGAGNVNIIVGVCATPGATTTDLITALGRIGVAAAGGPCGACPGGTACVGVTTR